MRRGDWQIDGNRPGSRRYRMPQALGALALNLFLAGAPIGLSNALVGLAGFLGTTLGQVVLAAGLFGLSSLLTRTPNVATPKPSDVQTNIRQEISARRRVYGRYLVGSVIVFGFRRGQKSYLLHYICEGPIHSYVSFRLDKKPVTLDSSGYVTDAQYQNGGRSRVQILTTLGTMTDEPFEALLSAFPELDDPSKPFRHRGCAMALQIVEQVAQEDLADVYPNNMPSLQFVIDGFDEVYDPRTQTHGFSENGASCLLTETMDVYGLTPDDTDDIDFDAFSAFATHCDDNISLKAGGTEKRYRCAGVVQLDAENETRVSAIANVCNADVYVDKRGRISVRRKIDLTPGIALRAENGDHLDVLLEGGRKLQRQYNTIKVTYTERGLNYKANEVRWQHQGFYDDDGQEYSETLDVTMCPSATQAQRLGKLKLHLDNPEFIGSFSSGPQGLDVAENPVFTLDLAPEDAFSAVAIVTGDLSYDQQSQVVSASISIPHDDAMDWVPAIDEQDQVVIPPDLPSDIDDVLLDVTASVELQANSAPVLRFSWEAAGSEVLPDSYSQQLQVSAADANDWSDASVNNAARTALFSPVADGGAYDWRIRNFVNGTPFDWQFSTTPITVTVDATAPAALTAFSAGDGTGQFVANFATTNDTHLSTVAIYRVPSGVVLNETTHLMGRYAVAPGIAYALPIISAAGIFDIYARPFNVSSVPGPLSGPDAATVS